MVDAMPMTPFRRLAAAAVLIGALAGCRSGRSAGPVTAPASGRSIALTTTTPRPATSAPPSTEAPITAELRTILLSTADMPAGFAAAPAADTGDDLVSLSACGRALVDSRARTADVRRVLVRARDRLRMVEQVDGFATIGAAARPLAALRDLALGCHHDGATSVTATGPPAVGEDVAGLRISGPTRDVWVAMVRSGPVVTIIVLGADRSVPAATFDAVVRAAGTRLAIGTGG